MVLIQIDHTRFNLFCNFTKFTTDECKSICQKRLLKVNNKLANILVFNINEPTAKSTGVECAKFDKPNLEGGSVISAEIKQTDTCGMFIIKDSFFNEINLLTEDKH